MRPAMGMIQESTSEFKPWVTRVTPAACEFATAAKARKPDKRRTQAARFRDGKRELRSRIRWRQVLKRSAKYQWGVSDAAVLKPQEQFSLIQEPDEGEDHDHDDDL